MPLRFVLSDEQQTKSAPWAITPVLASYLLRRLGKSHAQLEWGWRWLKYRCFRAWARICDELLDSSRSCTKASPNGRI